MKMTDEQEQGKTAFTVRMDDGLLEAARTVAGIQGQSMNVYVVRAVRRALAEDAGSEASREALLRRLESAVGDAV